MAKPILVVKFKSMPYDVLGQVQTSLDKKLIDYHVLVMTDKLIETEIEINVHNSDATNIEFEDLKNQVLESCK